MTRALEGLRILDLSMYLPGPYMTWLLAGLGAEVVKVENPDGGDYARGMSLGPGRHSPFFEAVNRNKKSVAINLKSPEGRDLFLKLVERSDVLVEGFRPGVMAGLNLAYDTLAEIQPRLIQVSISGFGQDGPLRSRAGHDLTYLALAGVIGMSGTRQGEPGVLGVQLADLAGGSLMALPALLAALIQRERTGKGQFIDVSMFDGAFSLSTMIFPIVSAGLEEPLPGRMMLNGRFPMYGLYRTCDGRHMALAALEFKFWRNFCQAVGRPDLEPCQFGGPEIIAELETLFISRTQAEWTELFREVDACCEPVLRLDEAADSELCRTRHLVRTGPDGARQLAPPFRLSDSPPEDDRPAPALGQDNADVFGALGLSPEELAQLKKRRVI